MMIWTKCIFVLKDDLTGCLGGSPGGVHTTFIYTVLYFNSGSTLTLFTVYLLSTMNVCEASIQSWDLVTTHQFIQLMSIWHRI